MGCGLLRKIPWTVYGSRRGRDWVWMDQSSWVAGKFRESGFTPSWRPTLEIRAAHGKSPEPLIPCLSPAALRKIPLLPHDALGPAAFKSTDTAPGACAGSLSDLEPTHR